MSKTKRVTLTPRKGADFAAALHGRKAGAIPHRNTRRKRTRGSAKRAAIREGW